MRGILPQTPITLLIVKEQISSAWAIDLHMFQLPKNRVTLQYVHDHPHHPRDGADQDGLPSSPSA